MAEAKSITIHYFAVLKDERGCSTETLDTGARTAAELYEELRSRYHFSLPKERLRVAINEEFRPWSTVLEDNDALAYIPPVAGG